uniref:Uncharacterized protein n=1 Tax=Timema bartmani TaxID=61472 RepID=A0A7R9EMJ1_9NEOP|nr:unnamed protein product [Timema bartmani]
MFVLFCLCSGDIKHINQVLHLLLDSRHRLDALVSRVVVSAQEVWYPRTTAGLVVKQSALRQRHELVLEEQLFVEKANTKE